MTELKTLNELEEEMKYKVDDGFEIIKRIKQEAIKWVKEKSTYYSKKENYILFVDDKQKEWIKYFFNLTEKDLK